MADLEKSLKIFPRQTGVYVNPYGSDNEKTVRKVRAEVCGYKAPETALTRNYIDKKCPFTGDVNVHGRIIRAVVKKMKAEKTIVVVVNYLHYSKKYKRYSRRHTNLSVHMSPCFEGMISVGDSVICGETRPLSKTKSYVVLGCIKKSTPQKEFKLLESI
ncbi:ribosomal protein S11 [Ordospora colligata]|uniref:Small ribosomal subunit protein uS17 n=1 Tax=Ordospora colligata OC4 TaxID=1354746 RepID=A0A0B2ULJ6_9MICR|nr:ribosomal protein S11 [Ordospora colligata OC4]KHN69912.1 ribosomal protein S11 [Ordospora colligata OC4]TBU16082.1 ribosomal protein S11 [Ordospora colligata]TBU16295.1 ribosomal protein S11 [Ordospora colligata]TBU18999.1 ribosomal protein S11 [Ordospora colligata]